MLQSRQNDKSMLGLSESKLGCDVPDSFLHVENFHCCRKNKMQGSGGILVYVSSECNRRKNLEDKDFEGMWLEIFPKTADHFWLDTSFETPFRTSAGKKHLMTRSKSYDRRKRGPYFRRF